VRFLEYVGALRAAGVPLAEASAVAAERLIGVPKVHDARLAVLITQSIAELERYLRAVTLLWQVAQERADRDPPGGDPPSAP
jgi:hypothetical protein